MKKLLILFLVGITTFSCSSDNEETTQDPIIGTWTLFSRNNQEVNDCQKKSTVSFTENGNYNNTGYYLDNTNNNCIADYNENGGWENNNGNYIIKVDNVNNQVPISFSNNNNTMTVTITDGGTTTLTYNKI